MTNEEFRDRVLTVVSEASKPIMTKREMLAGMAMEQLIGSVMCGYNEVYQRQLIDWKEKYGDNTPVKTALCKDAIELADELLKQLES